MLKIGITGGIGSGKSTVCQVFETLGIPVLYADNIAKYLMENDLGLRQRIIQILSEEAYEGLKINRNYIGNIVFNNPEKLMQLNAITHPAVLSYSNNWMIRQKSAYVIKEAALFFESGSDKSMDIMIGVSSPLKLRIQRIIFRENISEEKVLDRMKNQMNEEKKMRMCHYVIVNDEKSSIIDQVESLHQIFKEKSS
jgi:dephospho-CoA kinase